MKYYHVTDEKSAEKIMKEGLIPQIGGNSSAVSEKEKRIYLCRKKDVPYWSILLGKSVVLCISNVEIAEENFFDYGEYGEYFYDEKIEPSKVRRSSMKVSTEEAMKELCLSYIWTLGSVLVYAARYYTYPDKTDEEEKQYVAEDLQSMVNILPRLDYSTCTDKMIKDEIRESGDGRYSLCDYYCNTHHRLYSQLLYYPKDELTEVRKELYEIIKKTFGKNLRVETGGWCG